MRKSTPLWSGVDRGHDQTSETSEPSPSGAELYSKVVAEGSSGVSWVMDQITLPMQQEWIRHARTYYDSLSLSTAPRCGPLNDGLTPRRSAAFGASHCSGSRHTGSAVCGPTRWPGTAGHRPAWVSPRTGRANGPWRRPCAGAAGA